MQTSKLGILRATYRAAVQHNGITHALSRALLHAICLERGLCRVHLSPAPVLAVNSIAEESDRDMPAGALVLTSHSPWLWCLTGRERR